MRRAHPTGWLIAVLTLAAGIIQAPTAEAVAPRTGMPLGNETHWIQVYAQDFNTPTPVGQFERVYGKNLAGYDNIPDHSNTGRFAPGQTLSVQKSIAGNGYLDMWVHPDRYGRELEAAPIPTGYRGLLYGKFIVRYRSDVIARVKTSFMMWTTRGRWADGEIDWPEAGAGGRFAGWNHCLGAFMRQGCERWIDTSTRTSTTWHTVTIAWEPKRLIVYNDGALVGITYKDIPHDYPMRWTLQVESFPVGDKTTKLGSGHVQIDWLTYYAWRP